MPLFMLSADPQINCGPNVLTVTGHRLHHPDSGQNKKHLRKVYHNPSSRSTSDFLHLPFPGRQEQDKSKEASMPKVTAPGLCIPVPSFYAIPPEQRRVDSAALRWHHQKTQALQKEE